uniref:Uncharacterized protein n=1 Tax=Magallana gigas TaxID=29159 RepID=K1S691_MAGGI
MTKFTALSTSTCSQLTVLLLSHGYTPNGSNAGISYHGIISLTQLWVQAFGIKNGDLSPDLRLTKTIDMPNTTRVMRMCGGGVATTQSLSLMFYGDWILNFIFSHALLDSSTRSPLLLDGAMYEIKEISLEYNISSYLFPDADAKDANFDP